MAVLADGPEIPFAVPGGGLDGGLELRLLGAGPRGLLGQAEAVRDLRVGDESVPELEGDMTDSPL